MLDRSKAMQGYLNRIVYAQYQNAQRTRWMTENASEGPDKWEPLNERYKKWKIGYYSGFPGNGSKMLIATGKLYQDVVERPNKLVSDKSLEISWTTEYAPDVDMVRPFSVFGQETMNEIYSGLGEFIMKGILRNI